MDAKAAVDRAKQEMAAALDAERARDRDELLEISVDDLEQVAPAMRLQAFQDVRSSLRRIDLSRSEALRGFLRGALGSRSRKILAISCTSSGLCLTSFPI